MPTIGLKIWFGEGGWVAYITCLHAYIFFIRTKALAVSHQGPSNGNAVALAYFVQSFITRTASGYLQNGPTLRFG